MIGSDSAHTGAGPLFKRFASIADQNGSAVAASRGAHALTYGQLLDRVDGFASTLRQAGVGQGHLVVVDRSGTDFLIAVLGVLAVGAVYLPADKKDSSSRSRDLLKHARANYFIGAAGGVERSSDTEPRFSGPLGPDFPAYVMYTSGSTGRPKGVVVPHRAVLRLAADPAWIGLGAQTRTYAMAPVAFDASTFELWAALLNGGTIVFPAKNAVSLLSIVTDIARSEVHELWLPSGVFSVLVERHLSGLRGLRHLITGGDVVSVPHAERAAAALENCRVINGYGPTENTTFSTTYRISPGERLGASVPIGTPIDGTIVEVLDDDLMPVQPGEAGQLAVGGVGLALGYLHDPELTSRFFVPDPIHDRSHSLYLTGDIVRDRGDGNLLFMGRHDNQVKVRGYRVETAEIESALSRHPSVKQAAVLASSTDERKQLTAYVVLNQPVDNADLRRFLGSLLPDYMVPTAMMQVVSMPLTPRGKIDRVRLAALADESVAAGTPVAPPVNELERRLIHVFERILGIHPIGAEDRFFYCGGDSLAGLELLETLNVLFGVDLDSGQLLARDTPRALALLVQDSLQPCSSPIIPMKSDGHRPPFFCIHGGGGEVLFLADLRRYLSHAQPFYAIAPPGLNTDLNTLTRVEEFASHYAKVIRAEHGLGPYAIGGLCFGGNIAIETARHLLDAGADLKAVVLFDTIFPSRFRVATEILRHRLRQTIRAAKGMRATTDGLWSSWTRARGSLVERGILRAVSRYRPHVYPGRIGLFLGDNARFIGTADPRLGWATLGRDVDIRRVPGTRSSMFSGENARALAAELEAYLLAVHDD